MKFSLHIEGDTTDRQAVSVLALIASIADGTVPVSFQAAPGASPQPVTAVAVAEADDGPVNTNAPAVDMQGIAWDERIHAASKAVIGDGSWRRKRNISDELYDSVIAELRARANASAIAVQPLAAAPAAVAPVTTPVVAALPMPTEAAPAAIAPLAAAPTPLAASPAPTETVQAAVPAPVSAPAAAAPAAGNPATEFQPFMVAVGGGMQAGKIDAAYIAQLAQRLGLPTAITDLMGRPDLIPVAYATLQAEGKLA